MEVQTEHGSMNEAYPSPQKSDGNKTVLPSASPSAAGFVGMYIDYKKCCSVALLPIPP